MTRARSRFRPWSQAPPAQQVLVLTRSSVRRREAFIQLSTPPTGNITTARALHRSYHAPYLRATRKGIFCRDKNLAWRPSKAFPLPLVAINPFCRGLSTTSSNMDSMGSLDKSLPKTQRQPDVHQSFRTAALNVTNLYKAALADLDRARSDGNQDALDELLEFLDRENIGHGNGEGWKIRQWVAERLEGALPKQTGSDSDEDELEDKRARSSSPIMEHSVVPDYSAAQENIVEATHRSDSAPPLQPEAPNPEGDMASMNHVFQFSASPSYPPTNTSDNTVSEFTAAARRGFPNARRSSNRPSSRSLPRSAAQTLLQLGNGAGQKRRIMHDFFNVDGFNDRRDGSSGGPKRGRMT
ncbi:hypothetical protein ACEQ8H_005226 [Pleosporales sp. CAS-2024a]